MSGINNVHKHEGKIIPDNKEVSQEVKKTYSEEEVKLMIHDKVKKVRQELNQKQVYKNIIIDLDPSYFIVKYDKLKIMAKNQNMRTADLELLLASAVLFDLFKHKTPYFTVSDLSLITNTGDINTRKALKACIDKGWIEYVGMGTYNKRGVNTSKKGERNYCLTGSGSSYVGFIANEISSHMVNVIKTLNKKHRLIKS